MFLNCTCEDHWHSGKPGEGDRQQSGGRHGRIFREEAIAGMWWKESVCVMKQKMHFQSLKENIIKSLSVGNMVSVHIICFRLLLCLSLREGYTSLPHSGQAWANTPISLCHRLEVAYQDRLRQPLSQWGQHEQCCASLQWTCNWVRKKSVVVKLLDPQMLQHRLSWLIGRLEPN